MVLEENVKDILLLSWYKECLLMQATKNRNSEW